MTDPITDEAYERRFVELVGQSWTYHRIWEEARRSDDLAFGSAIAAYVDAGWRLIDIESSGTAHMARFQQGTDRLVISIEALAEDPTRARTIGRLIEVTVGYGQRVANFGQVKDAVKQEMKSGMMSQASEPGVITVDGDISSGYVYANVNLILNLDDYFDGVRETRSVAGDLYTAVHSLRKYLIGRLS